MALTVRNDYRKAFNCFPLQSVSIFIIFFAACGITIIVLRLIENHNFTDVTVILSVFSIISLVGALCTALIVAIVCLAVVARFLLYGYTAAITAQIIETITAWIIIAFKEAARQKNAKPGPTKTDLYIAGGRTMILIVLIIVSKLWIFGYLFSLGEVLEKGGTGWEKLSVFDIEKELMKGRAIKKPSYIIYLQEKVGNLIAFVSENTNATRDKEDISLNHSNSRLTSISGSIITSDPPPFKHFELLKSRETLPCKETLCNQKAYDVSLGQDSEENIPLSPSKSVITKPNNILIRKKPRVFHVPRRHFPTKSSPIELPNNPPSSDPLYVKQLYDPTQVSCENETLTRIKNDNSKSIYDELDIASLPSDAIIETASLSLTRFNSASSNPLDLSTPQSLLSLSPSLSVVTASPITALSDRNMCSIDKSFMSLPYLCKNSINFFSNVHSEEEESIEHSCLKSFHSETYNDHHVIMQLRSTPLLDITF